MILKPESGGSPGTPWRRAFAIAAGLAALTVAVFWPLRGSDFVNFDDPDYVTANPWVRNGLSLKGIGWAFTETHAQNWHPLTWISHMVDAGLFDLDAGAHHLVSVSFHAVNTALLFLVLWWMTGALGRSVMVAALFAFHPLHVESVAWVAERKDVLSGFFWLLTIGAYVRYTRGQQKRDYLLALFFFALGLMSKPMVVTLPCVLLLLDVWPLGRAKPGPAGTTVIGPLFKEKAPFFLLAAISSVVTFVAQHHGGAVVSLEHIPPGLRVENAFISYVGYLAKMVWPTNLSVYYPYPDSWPLWLAAGAALLMVGVTVIVVRGWQARPWLTVGWLWYIGTLVPVIGLVQVGEQAMADRYTYLPLIGIFVMVVWGVAEWASKFQQRAAILSAVGTLVVLGCVLATRAQLHRWRNGETLFQEALRVAPGALVRVKLANSLTQQGKLAEAVTEYQTALRLNPRFPGAQYNLGLTFAKMGRWPEAVAAYEEALRQQPDHADAHNNLAVALATLGKFDEARTHLVEVLRLTPGDPGALNNLGMALAAVGRFAEASECYAEAVRQKPQNPKVHLNWGIALANAGKLEDAAEHLREVLLLEPGNARAHNELGQVLVAQGNPGPALEHYATAVRLKPDLVEARVNLGLALAALGRLDEAEKVLAQAVTLKPNDANVHNSLGFVYARQNRLRGATEHYSAALRLRPDLAAALNGLAWIRATAQDAELRDGNEAVRLAEQACKLANRQQPAFLDTLAAAYAEMRRFDDAQAAAREALGLAKQLGDPDLAAELNGRIESYKANQPWRQK